MTTPLDPTTAAFVDDFLQSTDPEPEGGRKPQLEPALWPELYVRVMCDYGGSPCWNRRGAPESPFTLPISRALAVRMRAWFAWMDAQDPFAGDGPDGIPETGRSWYGAEGQAIARALRDELPPEWTVVLHDTTRPIGAREYTLD